MTAPADAPLQGPVPADAPVPDTSTIRILEAALRLLREGSPPPGRVADIPCGSGYFSARAAREGWTVSAYDLDPSIWRSASPRPGRVDLNGPLPLPDGRFDAVSCCEGLEHIENPWLVLREFRRILRPGGTLIVSIPNTVDLRQRWRFASKGYWGHYLPDAADHVNAMGSFMLCHALLRTGWRIRAMDVPRAYGGPLLAAVAPLFRYGPACGLPEEVRAMLSSSRVLRGRTLVVRATSDGTPTPRG